jgi:hypothetical protein
MQNRSLYAIASAPLGQIHQRYFAFFIPLTERIKSTIFKNYYFLKVIHVDGIIDFLKELVNPESIIRYGGIYLLLFVVFAETGLFIGFFLPVITAIPFVYNSIKKKFENRIVKLDQRKTNI